MYTCMMKHWLHSHQQHPTKMATKSGFDSEEVRRKPASCQPPQPPAEAAPNNENYDILVIGRTGMGKSSTVDKLMVLSSQQPHGGNKQGVPASASRPVPYSATGNQGENEVQLQFEDLLSVLVTDKQAEIDTSEKRLKNIVFCRNIDNSHSEIDTMRNNEDDESQDLYKSSSRCHLIINETSKIRTLDTPGFFNPQHVYGATNTADSNLAIVRHIIRLQALAGLRFRRTLYFLPQTGPLRRSDRSLQDEIQKLVKFFGKSVFRSMVLVATVQEEFSKDPEMSPEKKFPQKKLESTRKHFQEALVREFEERMINMDGLPEPPIIFLAMTDTCQDIFEKIKAAPVESDDAPQLEFNSNTCSRCAIEIGMRDDNNLMVEYRETGTNRWTNAIAYDESFCHPTMLHIYTSKSIRRGIAGLFRLKWYGFAEDVCVNCNNGPGCKGCMKVGKVYEEEGYEPITVRHSDKLDKKRAKAKA